MIPDLIRVTRHANALTISIDGQELSPMLIVTSVTLTDDANAGGPCLTLKLHGNRIVMDAANDAPEGEDDDGQAPSQDQTQTPDDSVRLPEATQVSDS